MNRSNINNLRHVGQVTNIGSSRGFTIVELLIVIVVIGILAAIVIVAYNGVTARANDSAAKAASITLRKKLEAYNATQGRLPTTTATTDLSADTSATLTGSGITIGTPTAATGKSTVQLKLCTAPAAATGYQITAWDFIANTLSTTPTAGGTNGTACTTYSTAT